MSAVFDAAALPQAPQPLRHLVLVLGDQLDPASSALDGFDAAQDAIWMAEVAEESTHVWSSQQRTAVFLAAMRHYALARAAEGRAVDYTPLQAGLPTLGQALTQAISRLRPQALLMSAPGDWRVLQALRQVAKAQGLALEIRDDRHFFASVRDFAAWAGGRKQLRMEYWYREMRRQHQVLLTPEGGPEGGDWNYDAANRGSFGAQGPGLLPAPAFPPPDAVTEEVLALVRTRFASHPGQLDQFLAGDPAQAQAVFDDWLQQRAAAFGPFQDAMWPGQPWLYHSLMASSLNLKLLDARAVVQQVEAAYRAGKLPLASAEGFIRQILGWREYVRGVYWTQMPAYAAHNALDAQQALPAWYWTGDTPMRCLREALQQTLEHGYAHHIQRLMVTGLYALLLGVRPQALHEWYLAVYVDAVEWVELPNTVGMSQWADGGLLASKPYIASGQYIAKMSGYCAGCRFKPAVSTGPDACPFSTLYWDFLARHEQRFEKHPRLALQVRNVQRLDEGQRRLIALQAAQLREHDGSPAV